ncbi:hypothetical protein [Pseudomonas viridiflava]|uniref:hypothetical protein n=1 Tax=Pseudomonas viridiflava TaxID=33069 RepID=UPI0005B6C6CB|nr:hypothetical protein [Pseudomonas viridiflava]KIQ36478.1 hypothetical protein RT94_05520 [Pseudomonas viridiflava]QXG27208.1 hypothetical protein KTT56_10310 [Pseudomonas viridiflava]
MSHKTRIVFTIKESGDGVPYLNMEFHDDIPGLQTDPPAFDLKPGTDMSKAREIAAYLNENLAAYRPFPLEPAASFQREVKPGY